jgi:hypothetical protein
VNGVGRPVAALERVEAILGNPATYVLAGVIPEFDPSRGGRRRDYPSFMWIVYEALLSVYGSARQVEAELSHPLVWALARRCVRRQFPNEPECWLPGRPMRRHHYIYGRNRYLTDPMILAELAARHRELAALQALEIGLVDPAGPGSWTHPDLSRMLHADGKVITPLYRARPGDRRVDPVTGEIRAKRSDPDAGLHFEGTGETAWGNKYVIVAARNDDVHGRIILDIEYVPAPGGEAAAAMTCFERLAPLLPGAQGVIYDTALRGVHHQRLLREFGWLPINRVTAKQANPSTARRADRRVDKSVHLEDKTITRPDGTSVSVKLFARGGTLGIVELDDRGNPIFEPLRRVRTHRNQDKNSQFRWYNDYQLPDRYGPGTITVRLHTNADDAKRKLNRTENLRPIPQDDPDFAALYARRNDAESINRYLDDTLWLGRAHSVGHRRQHVNLLGFALMTNSLARHRHHHRRRRPADLAA